jgi:SAM-dependent methyltransferase
LRAIVSAAPAYEALAADELRSALPSGTDRRRLAPGVWLVQGPGSFRDLARHLAGTVFPRHACPAQVEAALPERAAAWTEQEVAARLAPVLLPEVRRRPPAGCEGLQLQLRLLPGAPRWHPGTLAAALRRHALSQGVVTVGGPAPYAWSVVVSADRVWSGVARTADQLSPWPGGVARLRAAPDEVSRSARKLEEAVLLFGIPVGPGLRALDLGAAPGGWTGWLLARGCRVTAVDTAALAPSLRGRRGLSFLRGSVLRVPLPDGPFDLVCADLNWDPLRAAEGVLRFRPVLAAGAHGVFTIKFYGGDPLGTVARVRQRLTAGGLRVAAVRHLFHNRAEATAHLRA